MENYKTTLKRRLYGMAAYNLALIALICLALLRPAAGGDEHLQAFLAGFNTGLFAVAQATLVMSFVRYRRAIRDEQKLKAMYIQEHDERLLMIRSKIGGAATPIILYGQLAAVIASAYFSSVVFFTLLGALLFSVAVMIVLKIYYTKKIS
jgi:hypothetical protein